MFGHFESSYGVNRNIQGAPPGRRFDVRGVILLFRRRPVQVLLPRSSIGIFPSFWHNVKLICQSEISNKVLKLGIKNVINLTISDSNYRNKRRRNFVKHGEAAKSEQIYVVEGRIILQLTIIWLRMPVQLTYYVLHYLTHILLYRPAHTRLEWLTNGIREEQVNFCTPFSFMCHQYMRILQGGRGHGQVATGVSEYWKSSKICLLLLKESKKYNYGRALL